MKKIENKVMLITYADSMGSNLKELESALEKYFWGAVKGLHILPFFHPPEIAALRLSSMIEWILLSAIGRILTGWQRNIPWRRTLC